MQMDELEHRVSRKELPDPTFHVEHKHPSAPAVPPRGHSGIYGDDVQITGRRVRGARLTGMEDFFGTREPKKAPPVRPVVAKSVQEQLEEVQATVRKTEAETQANWAKNKY